MEFSENIVQHVWETARATADRDPTKWRKDECGAWIKRGHYGSPSSDFGWKIEVVTPGSHADDPNHLRPFQWNNSYDRGAGRTHCRVTADRNGVSATASIDSPQNKTID